MCRGCSRTSPSRSSVVSPGELWRHRKKDGTIIDVEIYSHRVDFAGRPASLVIVSDISERKRVERALRASEERIRVIIERAREAFVAMDEAGRIVEWNPQAGKTFGWTRPEAVGRPLADLLIPPRYREAHWQGLRRFLATGQATVLDRPLEMHALHRDGRELPVELSISAVREGAPVVSTASCATSASAGRPSKPCANARGSSKR